MAMIVNTVGSARRTMKLGAALALLLLAALLAPIGGAPGAGADQNEGSAGALLSAGTDFACAILADDTVKCWGRNNSGRLGHGDTVTRGNEPGEMGGNLPTVDLGTGRTATAISAGSTHACAL